MNCPVCRRRIEAHVIYCAKCGVYVHEKCWQEHVNQAHKK